MDGLMSVIIKDDVWCVREAIKIHWLQPFSIYIGKLYTALWLQPAVVKFAIDYQQASTTHLTELNILTAFL